MADNKSPTVDLLNLTADIVSSHVANNIVAVSDVAKLIENVYSSLKGLGGKPVDPEVPQDPFVPVRQSIKPDYLVCLECGNKQKMLKRHIMSNYQLTPDAYRAKWKLPPDYPMVAANYAAKRAQLAKNIGLGTKKARGKK